MSSFLHDFDLDRAKEVNDIIPHGLEESVFGLETPVNRS